MTENVGRAGDIPPTVNPPVQSTSQAANGGVQDENISPAASSIPKPVRPTPLVSEPAAKAPPSERPKPEKSTQREAKSEPVRVEHKRPARPHTSTLSSDYAVQVMASRTRADAVTLVRLLKTHGYHVFIVSPQQSQAKDHFYRVQVGPFASRAAADRARHKLEGEGFRPFITH